MMKFTEMVKKGLDPNKNLIKNKKKNLKKVLKKVSKLKM